MEEIILEIIIFPYSPRNKKVNSSLPYSVLKPETNSLSPSEKSKGARLVSAIIAIIQKKNTIGNVKKIILKLKNISENFNVFLSLQGISKIVIILIS